MDKKPYKVVKPVGIDGRKEVGEIVYLTDEEAQNLGSEFVVPESEQASAEASETEKTEEDAGDEAASA